MVRRRFVFAGFLVAVLAILGGPAVGISWGQGNPYVLDGDNLNYGVGQLSDSNGDFYDGSYVSSASSLQIINGGYLDLNNYNLTIAGLFDDYPASLSIPPVVGNSNSDGPNMSTLTIGGAGAQAAFYGSIGGSGIGTNIAVVINGPVSQTFYGVNGYTGGTTIQNGGLLGIYTDASLGTSAGPLSFINGGTLQAAGEGIVISSSRSVTINGGTATFDTNGFNNMTVNSPITGTGNLAKVGAGMLNLGSYNTYNGSTTVSGGTLAAAGPVGTTTLTVNSGAAFAVSQNGNVGLASMYYALGNGVMPLSSNFAALSTLQGHIGSLGTPTVSVTTPTIKLNTGGSPNFPAPIVNQNGAQWFEGYYSGMIDIPSSGTYTFGTGSDDGSMVWIDGTQVVSNNVFQGFSYNNQTGTITLGAGMHNIVIGYYQGTGGYALEATIKGPSDSGFSDIGASGTSYPVTPDAIVTSLTGSGNVVLQTGNLIVGTDNTNSTYSGTISSSGPGAAIAGIMKTGTGTLTLNAPQTYTGTTVIGAGTLQLGDGVNDGSLATSAVTDMGALVYNLVHNRTVSYPISGTGSVTKLGPNTLSLNGNNTYSGQTTVTGGSMSLAGSPTGPISVANAGLLLTGNPTGAISVTSGNVTFGSNSSPTGPISMNSSTLNLTPVGQSGLLAQFYGGATYFANNFNSTGGTVSLAAYNAYMNTLTPGTTVTTAANNYLTLNFPDGTYNNGPFGGILPSNASYTGNYDVRLSGYITVPTSGTYYFRTGSDDGSVVWLNGSEIVNNNYYQGVTWRGSGAIQLTAGIDYPISVEYYQGGGGEALDVQYSPDNNNWTDVPNSVLLNAGQSYGALTIGSESTINLGAAANVPATFPSLSIGDTTLHVTGGNAQTGVTINGVTTLTGVSGTTFDVQGANTVTLGGTVSGTAPITKIGSGSLVLASDANYGSYSGAVTIGDAAGDFGGTLAAASSGALGSNATVTVNNGILDIQAGYTESRQLVLNHPNSTIQVDAGTYTPSLPLSFGANGALTKAGAGTLALTNLTLPTTQNVTAAGGAIDFGGTSVSVNILTLSGGTVSNGVITPAAIAAQSGTINAQLTGSAALVKSTSGTVVMNNGASNYTGGTNIQGGLLQIAGSGEIPSGTITMSGGTLQFSGLAAGLKSTYYGGQGNGITLNGTYGVSPNNWDINNLTLTQLQGVVATLPVGLVTNTTVKGGQGSFFVGNSSSMFDAPYNSDAADNFIDTYTGYIDIPVTGSYQFQANGDDRARIWLDNSNSETVYTGGTQTFTLTAGYHAITIAHEEYGGGQWVYANIQGPAGSGLTTNQNIPNYLNGSPLLVSSPLTASMANSVTLSGSATIDVPLTGLLSLQGLTMNPGSALTVSSNEVQFTSTTLTGAGTFGLNVLSSLVTGSFSDGGNVATVNVTGAGALVLNSAANSLPDTTFAVSGGKLMFVGGSGAVASQAGATVTLANGGSLELASTDTTAINYDLVAQKVSFGQNVNFIAGADYAGEGGSVSGDTINLSNGGNAFNISAGNYLGFSAQNSATLSIAPQVNVASGGTLTSSGAPGGRVYLSTLSNASGAVVAPTGGDFIIANQQTNGQFSPSGSGGVTFSGGFNGDASQLTPGAGGTIYLPTANTGMTVSSGTVNVAGGAWILGSQFSLGAYPPGTTLELDGGTLGASAALTGTAAVANPLVFGANQTVNIAGSTTMVPTTSAITFTSPISLTNGVYTFNDPNGRSTFSGVLSGAGAVVIAPVNGNPNNTYTNGQTYQSPEFAGFNTYTGGTTIDDAVVAITNRQAFGTGTLNFNWGGINALTNLTGELAVANTWTSTANEMWFRGPSSIELSGNGTITGNTTFRIPDGNTVTISGAISGSGYFQRSGDTVGTLVLNDPLSTYNGSNGGNNDGWYHSSNNTGNYYNGTGFTYNIPQTSFFKNDNGGDQNSQFGTSVVLMCSSSGSGTNVTNGPFGTGSVRWQYWGSLANGTPGVLTVGNDFVMEGDMGVEGGAGMTFTGDWLIGNRDRGAGSQYREFAASGNVTLAGRLISIDNWGGSYAGFDLRQGSGGIVTLSGDNSMLCGVSVTQGTLQAGSNTALGPAVQTVQLGNANTAGTNDGTIELLAAAGVTVPNAISVNAFGNGTTLGGAGAFSGAITLAQGITIASAATGQSAVTFSGAIGGTGGVNVVGPGNVVFAASNTYTGTTAVNSGVLALDFSQATSPANNIVSASSPLSLGGGTLAVLGNSGMTNNQAFNNTTIVAGASAVALNPLSNGTTNLALGTITRSAGATVDFNLIGSGAISTASGASGQILTDTNGVAYATVNGGSDWAAVSSGNIVGLTSVGGYTSSTQGLSGNVDINSSPTLSGAATMTSLRFNQASGNTVDVAGNSLTTGGILVTPTDGGSQIIDGVGNGGLSGPANGELVVSQNSSAPFTISANITGAGLTKSGAGTLILGGNNTYTGPTYVNGGVLQAPAASLPTNVVMSGNSNLTIQDATSAPTFAQSISGKGSLTVNMTNGGNLTLSGTNTYSGATHIMAGSTLTLSPAQAGLSQYYYTGGNFSQTTGWTSAGVAPGAMAGLYARGNGVSSPTTDAPVWGQGTSWQGSWQQAWNNSQDVTWTYTGYIYAATNTISLMGICDDSMQVKLNGNWIPNAATSGPYNTYATGIVKVTPGWVPIQISFFSTNGGGAGGYNSQGAYQIGCNPDGDGGNNAPAGSDFQVNEPGIAGSVATAASVIGINPGSGITFPTGTSQSSSTLFEAGPSPSLPANTAVTVDATATLNLNNTSASIGSLTGGGSIIGGGNLTTGGDNTSTTFSGQINGAITLSKTGTGIFTLDAQTGFTGYVAVSGGAIQLADGGVLANSPQVSVSVSQGLLFGPAVSSVALNNFNDTGNLALSNANGAPVALTVTGGSLSGVVSDGGAGGSITANMSGTQLLALSARNTYSGPTTINGGIFQANDGGGLPAASALTLNGAILQSDGPADFTRTIGTGAGQVQFSGNVGFAANGGKLTVNLDNGGLLEWGSGSNFVGEGDQLVFGSPMASAETELQNNIDLNGEQRTVVVNSGVGGDFATLSGTIMSTGPNAANGSLYKTGAGLLKLSGNNSFSGGLTVNAGTVQLANAGALNSTNPNAVAFTANSTGDLQLNGNSITIAALNGASGSPVVENASLLPATLTIGNGTGGSSFSGTIRDGANSATLSLAVNPGNGNAVVLSGTNSFSGAATVSSGTLQGNTSSLPTAVALANNSTVAFNQTSYGAYTQSITGAGSLVKTGSGVLLLQGANTYTGTTYVSGGTLRIGSPQAGLQEGWFGSAFDTTDPFSASVQQSVQLSPRAANWTGTINGTHNNGDPLATIQPGKWYDNSTVMYQGYMYIGAAAGSTVSFFEDFDDDKELVLNGSTLINNTNWNNASTANWTVPASGPGWYPIQLRFGQGGGGAGPNSGYTIGFGYDPNGVGGTTQSNYTFLTDPGDASLFTTGGYAAGNPASLPANPVVMSSNTALDLSNTPVTIASLSDAAGGASGQTVLLGTSGALTVGGNNASTTFSGAFSGSGSVTKVGGGALSLMGNNSSFAGTTNITAGTVQAVNSMGTGLLNIGNGTFQASNTFNLSTPVSLSSANAAVSVDAGQALTLTSSVSGSGGLNKTGGGMLTLKNIQATYAGPTVVSAGTLQLQGGLPPVTSGLVGFWPLNEGTGTVARDLSGVASPANGTLSGNASWVSVANAGTAGYPPFPVAVQINGNSPGVTMGAISAFGNSTTSTFGSARTISGWVELLPNTNNPGDWHDLFGFIGNEGSAGTFFDMESGNGGNFVTHTYGGDTTISPVVQGQWVYLTATADANANVTVYLDGQKMGGQQVQGGVLSTFDNFGIELSRAGWNEDVSDVTVYNRALSGAEVQQLYSQGVVANNMLPTATAVTVAASATLDLNGISQQVVSLSDNTPGSGGSIVNSNQTLPITLTLAPSSSTTFSGSINDNGSTNSISLLVNGTGTQVLAGTSNYSGTTTVSSGTLAFASIANADGATPSSLGMPSAANGTITLGSYSLSTTGTLQFVGNTSQSSNRTIRILNDNCAIDASGVNGAVLTLTGNGSNPAVDDSAGCNLVLSGSGKGVMSGAIIDNGGGAAVYKDGTGTWILTNPNNAYSGSTNVNAGVLVAGVVGALPTTTDVTVSGGTLDAQLAAQTVNSLTMTGGALNLAIGNLFTASSTASLTGTLDVFGTSSTSEELMAFPGGYTGTFANTIIPSGFTLSYQANQLDLLLASVGPPTWQVGSGNWNLGANWTGGTVPNGAQSTAVVNKPVGNSTVAITLDVPVTLGTLQLGNSTGTGGYTINGTVTNNLTFDNGTGTAVLSASDGTHTLATPITLNSSLSVSPSAGALIAISGNIGQGPGVTASLTLANSGELILGGADTYQGGTIVENGKLVFTSSASVPASGALIVGAGGIVAFDPSVTAGAVELVSSQQVVTAAPMVTAEVAAMASTVHAAGGAVEAVPEPGTLALLLAALGGALVWAPGVVRSRIARRGNRGV